MNPDASQGAAAEEDLVQLVAPDGRRTDGEQAAAYRDRAAHLGTDELWAMYRDMVLTRRFDDESTALQRQGELGLYPQGRGQEAAQVGSGHALHPQDFVFPSYREHGVLQVRGVDPVDRLRIYRGTEHGGWDPADHNVHLNTLVLGSQTLHATGYALGVQRDGLVGTGDPQRDTAVVTYFGDGASSQGDVNEALVFAAVNNAPVVFFCQNNQWAISEPTSRQTRVPLYKRGEGFGIPGVRVDGNDVLASYAVMAEALERARTGGGPTFVEAYTYRMGAHTTSDDPTRYRERAEEEEWALRDPIDRLAALLRAEDRWDDAWAADVEAQADSLAERLRADVRALEDPASTSMFEHVYATPHSQVEAERAWFEAYEHDTAQDERDSSREAAR
ncbi:pyruvate dehydrogenase (acetyl-transferring) E1 component subunit alpha [Isoptericola sp. S6320L]|uniref:pyruvate dehydrogenase (acetyl-transferring) E1 component subunit alpha n=1 Tax=Isoptericola sp. S6320L TaxID=2926411 RepID=UPI001FF0E5A2|nr:pyruvate dehydrogenase (acetyl-transferring) E1 component subunit alpha [Isoptericola sp. S6320L]MCK0117625.1 pyruvate dehydrogenase (acetyl-transferring) E1 component subunit alpha [Isoptericola sp. S6320L]